MEVVLIAAVAANGVIGADGDIPWHYPEDLRHFKETTLGHPVVMGRRTYESIESRLDGPLPGRTNVVLSRGDPDLPENVEHAQSIGDALRIAGDEGDTVYVIGGATVYEAFLQRADRLVLTELDRAFDGDTRFPEWDRDEWTEVDRDDHGEFAFVEYVRRE